MKQSSFLKRYTSLPMVLDILLNKRIALIDPYYWEDRNDSYFLIRYCQEKRKAKIYVICFTTRSETCHHWQVFSKGPAGACIEFSRSKLLDAFSNQDGFRMDDVLYFTTKSLKQKIPDVTNWPFIKRSPYRDEGEFRIIFESVNGLDTIKYVPINLEAIRRIILSPWLSEELSNSIKMIIKNIDGCEKLKVTKSSLLENKRWKTIVG